MTRTLLILAAALVVAGIIVVTVYRSTFIAERSGGEPVTVVVARQTIPFGEPVRLEMLTTRVLPSDYVEDRHIQDTRMRDLVGLPLAQTVRAGESIMSTDLSELSNYRRTLSGEIPTGSRAITLQVPYQSSFAGLLRPGDRVDVVLLTGAMQGELISATVLLQNALVLAIGQTIEGQVAEPGTSSRLRSITLQIGPSDGVRLAHARVEGQIHFLLRNGNDDHVVANTPQLGKIDLEVAALRERFLYRDRRRTDMELAAVAATAVAGGVTSVPEPGAPVVSEARTLQQ